MKIQCGVQLTSGITKFPCLGLTINILGQSGDIEAYSGVKFSYSFKSLF